MSDVMGTVEAFAPQHNIIAALRYDPVPYVLIFGQAACTGFNKGCCHGVCQSEFTGQLPFYRFRIILLWL